MEGYHPKNIVNEINEEERFGTYSLNQDGSKRNYHNHFEEIYNVFQQDPDMVYIWLMDSKQNELYGYTKIKKIDTITINKNNGYELFFSKSSNELFILEKFINLKKIGISLPSMFSMKKLKKEELEKIDKEVTKQKKVN